MVSAMVPAANATLLIFKPSLMNDVNWVAGIAALWLTFISAVLVKGIKITSYVQIAMTAIEGIILLVIIVMAFIVFLQAPVREFSWSWFSVFEFTPTLFATGTLTGIFFYYGWDVTLNLSEETRDLDRTPGRAAFWSMIILMLFFMVFIVIVLLGLTDEEIQHYNTNIIFAIAEKLLGKTWGYIAIVAVLLSTIGTVETQMIQFTRTMFAKGRDGVLNPRYSRLHKTWQTPYFAIFFIWITGLCLLFLSSYLDSINQILLFSITAIGFQISFYLGLTGFAYAWFYRKTLLTDFKGSLTRVIWPAVSASFLYFIAIYSIPTFDPLTTVVGIGGIAIGLVPLGLNRWRIYRARVQPA